MTNEHPVEPNFTGLGNGMLMEPVEAIQKINIIRNILSDDGQFPNNALLPLLIYQKAMNLPGTGRTKMVMEFLETNGWVNAWENGVYDYHHYHSSAHEVLVIVKGSARIQFGGPGGVAFLVEETDCVIIPAGVAHMAIDLYDDFTCVGAYPAGQDRQRNQQYREMDDARERRAPQPAGEALDLPLRNRSHAQSRPTL